MSLAKPVPRRNVLKAIGGMGLALVGCNNMVLSALDDAGGSDGGGTGDLDNGGGTGDLANSGGTGDLTPGTCHTSPEETAGPYPDKTGMYGNQAFYRSDITEGKTGLPLTVTFTVVDVAGGCQPVAGAVVEVWHCDKDGVYSEYGNQPGVPDQTGTTFLRGLQTTDAAGQVKFKTIYPGWYQGRATHIHVEVFRAGNARAVKTTQMAFPEEINNAVYSRVALYNKGLNPMKNGSDMVFSDGDEYELGSLAGDTTNGYAAVLVLGV